MKRSLVFLITGILVLSSLSFILAEEFNSCFDAEVPNTASEFFSQITTLNSKLNECPIQVPSSIDFLVGDGNVLSSITLNSGNVQNFYVAFEKKNVTSIMLGETEDYDYELITDEETINEILNSDDYQGNILDAYRDEKLQIKPKGLINKFKWFLGKLFIPK